MMKQQIARILCRLHGWKLVGKPMPEEIYRSMFVFAPHTTNWDFYHGLLNMIAWGVPVKVAIKNYWTRFPFSLLVKPLGGVGIDRTPKKFGEGKSQVLGMAAVFKDYDKIAFIITPEGSRAKRTRWKTGFYQIAKMADVPIVIMTADYNSREIEFGPVLSPHDSLESVMKSMMAFYAGRGAGARYPENFALDERYA